MDKKLPVPQGYQQTEIGVIPQDWDVVSFNDLRDKSVRYSITGGPFGSNLKREHYTSNGIIIIQLQNIGDGTFISNDFIYTSDSKAIELKSCLIYPNDIILAKMAEPVARACIIPNFNTRFLMGSDGIRLHINRNKYNNRFILELINHENFRKIAISRSTGSTRQRIGLNDLKTILTAIPPLKEQQKIADILTTWDNAIEKQTALIKQKQQLKTGLMQQIFSQSVRFKADDGSNFPDWEVKKLGNVGSFKSGTGFAEVEQGGKSGTPFFKVSDMNIESNQEVMVLANNYVNDEQITRLNYKPINKKSVIFAKVGAAVFLERKRIADNFLIDNNMMAFTPTEDINFIRQWFNTVKLSKYVQVGALPSYNASDLKTIKINIPSIHEQTKISKILTLTDNEITKLQTELALLKTQKKGLMQQLLTGKIRVKI
ncbi:MAG: restriction endonuclease subunit S [Methylococcales symbiont of Hymedesmia sp. n. MRB-2018]|nr:MAG: restriction endonuclease subunit S [Methylococcales symbiont of Hymedesmia sp. n. MRB-2018]